MKPHLLSLALILLFSCNKDELVIPNKTYEYHYHYQVDSQIEPFTIQWYDANGNYKQLAKTHTDCSLFYKCNTTISQKVISVNINQSDAKISLWITKNDTVMASATGFTNVTLFVTV